MFNSSTPPINTARYLYNLTKYYKIWFSLNPNIALGPENELRLIRAKAKAKDTTLSLIYSSKCLTDKAKSDLGNFCKQHSINLVEFETLESMLENEQDKKMFQLAKNELDKVLDKTGGNIGSAADFVRLILPVIENYGIYSDLDTECNLAQLNASFLQLRGPVLLPIEMLPTPQSKFCLNFNSDFLAFSITQENPDKLSPKATEALRSLQTAIINKYQKNFTWEVLADDVLITGLAYDVLPNLIKDFYAQYPGNRTVYDFRKFVSSLPDMPVSSTQPESLNTFLMRISVISMSGPGVYSALFNNALPKGETRIPTLIPFDETKWKTLLQQQELCSTGFYDPIYDLIKTENSFFGMLKARTTGKSNNPADQSWTAKGILNKQERERKMDDATKTIQSFWRHTFHNQHYLANVVSARINKICKDKEVLTPLKEKNYTLALKKACARLNLDVIKILLHYKISKNLNLDLNAPSSNGNTALDWAKEAKTVSPAQKSKQKEIIGFMEKNGALSGAEIKKLQVN